MADIGGPANPAAGFTPSQNQGPSIDYNPQAPKGPAPQVTSFQNASAQTMAQKQALLDSIAQHGTAGKAMYAQQQQALSAVRNNAIASQLQGAFSQYAGTGGDLAAANARSAGAVTAAQNSLGDFTNAMQRSNADYYDNVNAQIPIAQEFTQRQVNAIKARQDQAAEEAELRREQMRREAEMQAMQLEIAKTNLSKARLAESGGGMDPLDRRLKELGIQKAEADIASNQAKRERTPKQNEVLMQALNTKGIGDGHGNTNSYRIITYVLSKADDLTDAMAGLGAIMAGQSPDFPPGSYSTPRGNPLNVNALRDWITRYYTA